MPDENLTRLRDRLDTLAQPSPADGGVFWFARDLMEPLGYARRETFMPALRRAAAACKVADRDGGPHFHGIVRMMPDGKGSERAVTDFKLTRHACHLLAMNGDPRRKPIAFARDYFAPRPSRVEAVEKPAADPVRGDIASRQPGSAPAASVTVTGESTAASPHPAAEDGGKKSPVWGISTRGHGQGGSPSNSRFIPHSGGHQFQGKWNQNRNAAWNQNLAVGRGHPNSGARNSK